MRDTASSHLIPEHLFDDDGQLVRACVRACVRVCVCVCLCARMRLCLLRV